MDNKKFIITNTRLRIATALDDEKFSCNTEPLLLQILKIIDKIILKTFKTKSTISIAKRELENLKNHIVSAKLIINKIKVRRNPIIKIIS